VTIRLSISSFTMSDGTSVSVPPGGIVVFVGPNNSGKSVSLRDIAGRVFQQQQAPRAVVDVRIEKEGSTEDLIQWLEKNCHKGQASGQTVYSRANVSQVYEGNLVSWWDSGPPFHALGSMFMFFAGGEGRLQAAHGVNSVDFMTQPPTHPLHFLYLDSALEKKISDVSVRAFKNRLVLNRHAGSMLYLHVGEAPPCTARPSGTDACVSRATAFFAPARRTGGWNEELYGAAAQYLGICLPVRTRRRTRGFSAPTPSTTARSDACERKGC
jgi:hypothetical protein